MLSDNRSIEVATGYWRLEDAVGTRETGMTQFGYTLMTEQTGPRDLVDYAIAAERAGFDFEV